MLYSKMRPLGSGLQPAAIDLSASEADALARGDTLTRFGNYDGREGTLSVCLTPKPTYCRDKFIGYWNEMIAQSGGCT